MTAHEGTTLMETMQVLPPQCHLPIHHPTFYGTLCYGEWVATQRGVSMLVMT